MAISLHGRELRLLAVTVVCSACHPTPGSGHVAEAGPVVRPAGPMNAEQAARYVVALVNHDRGEAGLEPVEWDDAAARAGARHAEDMARHGYTAHWGTDGSVPEERYTAAGGVHLVQENAACFFDGTERGLDDSQGYDAVDLEKLETAFMSEVPPQDGHKLNILKKTHTRLGVGVAIPAGVRQPCLSQEFVDDYGTFDGLPAEARPGQTVTVGGAVRAPATFGAIGVARIEPAKALSVAHLNRTYTYPMPAPFVLYSPHGYVTPKEVRLDGNRFSIDVPLSDHGRAGRYEVSVWVRFAADPKLSMVSLRVVNVR